MNFQLAFSKLLPNRKKKKQTYACS